MVKIKISYQTPEELEKVLRLMQPIIRSTKVKKGQQGILKKAYTEIDERAV